MWVGLLGPLEMRDSTGVVRVTAPKERSLLATLSLRAGNVVPVEALAEAVWDDVWPAQWQVTLRNYVQRIRKKLAPADRGRLAWRSPGYCLHLDPGESDLAAFQSLQKAGLAAANSGNWADAARNLSQAMSLWRGSALADIESRLVRVQHAHYLERQRMVTLEARIEADVRVSRRGSAAVLPELERLIEEYPEREQYYVLTMLALYRGGRRADCLDLYHRARRLLIEAQGIEPGSDLRSLHERILAGDTGLLAQPLVELAL
jgi:DNA-binding SARP family transcriptional activator